MTMVCGIDNMQPNIPTFILNVERSKNIPWEFRGIMWVPHTIVMNMNSIMMDKDFLTHFFSWSFMKF